MRVLERQRGKVMDKQEREEFMKQRIFSLLYRIEEKSGKMAHEIPEIMENLKKWQDGEIKSSYFNLTLCTYFDHMDFKEEL